MTLDTMRPYFDRYFSQAARGFMKAGFTANMLSVLSLVMAFFAGVCFAYSSTYNWLLPCGGVLLLFSSLLDALDGELARITRHATPKGDFLDHVVDRYADIFILLGVFAGGYVSWWIGAIIITGVLMTSYMGTQAQAVGSKRLYGGVMGRADRLTILFVATLVGYIVPDAFLGFSILGWAVIVIGVISHFTALQRFISVWGSLR